MNCDLLEEKPLLLLLYKNCKRRRAQRAFEPNEIAKWNTYNIYIYIYSN